MELIAPVRGGTPRVLHAVQFALRAHHEQYRKYTHEPYVTHVLNVAAGVALHTDDADIIAAALLHDVLEDTATTSEDLLLVFGPRVTRLVLELTDVYTTKAYPELNRGERKRREAERLAGITADAQLIKAFDMMDNLRGTREHDPGFHRVYLAEKQAIIRGLRDLPTPVRLELFEYAELT